ncbi:MAG: AAA family ATPase [Desulfovibrionaceae bacterium]|nr:AAA family ATPase [Desulfovibrionaceae bacterium]
MLSSLTIKNFKSYAEAVIPLASMTILTGPDAAGRSNALEAFRLLSLLARGMRLDDIGRMIQNGEAHIRGRAADLFNDMAEGLAISCRLDDPWSIWNEIMLETGMQDDRLVLQGEFVSSFSECRFIPIDTLASKDINAITYIFREQLRNIVFLAPSPASMRGYSFAGCGELQEDGSNLSGVLAKLCRQEQMKKSLLDFVSALCEPSITNISFITTERNDVMVRLHESFGNKEQKIDAPLLSDGTLRVLAVGAVLLSAPENALVVIEEADSGIYPGRAGFLAKQIQDIASSRNLRVLISSNNQALLNAVPDAALRDVLYCYRNREDGNSRLVRLGDLRRFPELTALGSLGDLMAGSRLDEFLNDTGTEADRRQAALAWLDELRRETEA